MNRREFTAAFLQAASLANEKIDQGRQAAIDLLKPSKRELDHGLQLHAESIVMESYGFAPRCAVDGDAIRTAVEAGASGVELQDMQEDQMMTRCVTSTAERAEFLAAWKAAGMTCIFQNAGEEGSDALRLMKRLARFTWVADSLRDQVPKAVTPDDIEAAKKQGRHCFYFSGNGVPLAQQWISAEAELGLIRPFFQLGIRMMHLTYNRRNVLGDGCAEPANGGISELGRAAIAEMNRQGVIVDVAHSGWRTSLEAAKASRKPMVASHSVCADLHKHIRGKPDEVIRAIADTGGYIGICCIPSFIGRTEDLKAMLDHIEYAVKKFGADHVAIGTDIAYISRNAAAESRKIPRRARSRTFYEAHWPPGALGNGPAHRSLDWTNWPMFTVGMVQRGFTDDQIRKVLAGNVLRVARAALA
jgi:membrane dipeptidase